MALAGRFKIAIVRRRREEIQNRFDSDIDGCGAECRAAQRDVAKDAETRSAIREAKKSFRRANPRSLPIARVRLRGRNFHGAIFSGGERGIFRQLHGAAIRVLLVAAEKQQAETVARPAIVIEPAVQARLPSRAFAREWIGRRAPACGFEILDFRVVGFRTARQRIHQRGVGLAAIERGNRGAVGGTEQGGVAVRCEIDFLVAVRVEIERGDILVMAGGIRERIGDRFRLDQAIATARCAGAANKGRRRRRASKDRCTGRAASSVRACSRASRKAWTGLRCARRACGLCAKRAAFSCAADSIRHIWRKSCARCRRARTAAFRCAPQIR